MISQLDSLLAPLIRFMSAFYSVLLSPYFPSQFPRAIHLSSSIPHPQIPIHPNPPFAQFPSASSNQQMGLMRSSFGGNLSAIKSIPFLPILPSRPTSAPLGNQQQPQQETANQFGI
jgi:hypothetical protein